MRANIEKWSEEDEKEAKVKGELGWSLANYLFGCEDWEMADGYYVSVYGERFCTVV